MLLLNWDDDYSVGVQKFDNQHQKLFNLINNFYESMKINRESDKVDETLKELVDYANIHLAEEEKYFEKFDYPLKDEHKKIHDEYRKKIQKFIDERKVGTENVLSFDIVDYLGKWWIDHIMGTDRLYTEFFKDKKID